MDIPRIDRVDQLRLFVEEQVRLTGRSERAVLMVLLAELDREQAQHADDADEGRRLGRVRKLAHAEFARLLSG